MASWVIMKYDDLQTCPTPRRPTNLWCNLYACSDCLEQPVAHAALFQSPFQRHEQVLQFSYNNQEKSQNAVTSHISYVNTWFEAERDTSMCVCPYLNCSSSKSGFWAFRYLLIVSSSLGTGSLQEVEHRDVHLMSKAMNEACVSHTAISLCLLSSISFFILLYILYIQICIHTLYCIYYYT